MSSQKRMVGVLAVLMLVASGCGARQSHEALMAPYRAASATEPAQEGPAASGSAAGSPSEVTGGGSAGATSAATDAGVAASSPAGTPSTPAGGTAPARSGSSPAAGQGAQVAAGAAPGAQPAAAGGAAKGPDGLSAPAPGTPSPAATAKATVRLGMLSTTSGVVGQSLIGGVRGAQAWVAYINARGGLNGHPVELFTVDDGADPARNRALAQFLVEEKKVITILLPQAALSGQGSVSYFQEKGIPNLGSEGGSPWTTRNSMYFPQMSSDPVFGPATVEAMADVFVPQGKKKVGIVFCAEAAGCAAYDRPPFFEDAGFEVVYRGKVSLAQPDFTAQCLAARNAGAQAMFLGFDTASVTRFADNCASVGFKPGYGIQGNTLTAGNLKNPNLEGLVPGMMVAPFFDTSIPAIADHAAQMAKFAPGVTLDMNTVVGWTAGKMLEEAGKNLTEATPQAILEGLWSIKDNDLGGLTMPITFEKGATKNGTLMPLCHWTVQAQDGKWVHVGGQRKCKAWDVNRWLN